MAEAYDADRNSRDGYDLAIASWREILIRRRQIQPRVGDAQEQRWAKEGERLPSQLDTVRNG